MTHTENLKAENASTISQQMLVLTQYTFPLGYNICNLKESIRTFIESGNFDMDKREIPKESIKRLSEIAVLKENWNGSGASAFSASIIGQAMALVSSLSIQPYILPTGRDSIQMEYENESGDYLEFELFEDGRLKMFSYTHDGKAEGGDISASSMDGMVRDFYERSV